MSGRAQFSTPESDKEVERIRSSCGRSEFAMRRHGSTFVMAKHVRWRAPVAPMATRAPSPSARALSAKKIADAAAHVERIRRISTIYGPTFAGLHKAEQAALIQSGRIWWSQSDIERKLAREPSAAVSSLLQVTRELHANSLPN